jgi:uncharacterized protein (DUF2062 family)
MAEWRKRLAKHLPTKESIQGSRWLRPFAKHLGRPDLWHLNHRSVPRGIALGLGVGILVPFMHIVLVAILAIPARANILLAAGFTLVINPLTMPPLYYSAYRIGRWQLHDPALPQGPAGGPAAAGEFATLMAWLHYAWEPIALGLITLAPLAAALGYAGGAIGWRLWTRGKPQEPEGAEI